MRLRTSLVALIQLALSGLPAAAVAACKIGKLAELPVTMTGLKPLVHAGINGTDALFLADSGAFFSLITPADLDRALRELQDRWAISTRRSQTTTPR
jgi:hypothetical protein